MATYIIGDIQGCYDEFRRLLKTIRFGEGRDRLWLVGDLVNRGPKSLEVLRWVYEHQDAVTCVLGNHDLHLLAVSIGLRPVKSGDTFRPILEAPDANVLLEWLRHRPLTWWEPPHFMIHAGLFPQWSVPIAHELGAEACERLRGSEWTTHLAVAYDKGKVQWDPGLIGADRFRTVIAGLTRLRACTQDGEMDVSFNGAFDQIPAGRMAWFDVPNRQSREGIIVCGHWSALGLRLSESLWALDTGCVWGRHLTAVRLEDRAVYQVASGSGAD